MNAQPELPATQPKSSMPMIFLAVAVGVVVLPAIFFAWTGYNATQHALQKVQALPGVPIRAGSDDATQHALQKVQAHAQDLMVKNNLRQLQMGAEQYFLENGVSSVASATIVGTNSTQYVRPFETITQESYAPVILKGQAITASGVAGARTITFGP